MLVFLLSSFFQRGRFDQLFLFDAPDTPPVPSSFYSGPLGVHSFGDFLQPLWQSRLSPSPFITGYSSYLPAANGFFWVLSWLTFWVAFLLFVSLSLIALLFPFWKSDQRLDGWARGQLIVGGVILTYPLLSALDRGNIQLLTVGLIILAIYASQENRPVSAGVLLGIAIGFKAYPILFALLFLKKKLWKSTWCAALTACVTTLIPLLLFDGGPGRNLRALLENLSSSQQELSSLALFSNNSLRALELSFGAAGFSTGQTLLENLLIPLSAILLVLLMFCALSKSCNPLELSLLISAICTLVIGFSAGYVLLLFFVPAFLIYRDDSQSSSRWLVFYSACIAFLIMPKQLPLHFWSDTYQRDGASLGSLLNPLTMVILVIVIFFKTGTSTWMTWRRSQLLKQSTQVISIPTV